MQIPKESNEKAYLRGAFICGALLIAGPLFYGSVRGFPKDFYIYFVPPIAGLLVIAYALENTSRHLRARIELLEDAERDRADPRTRTEAHPRFDSGRR
ncbi:MAG: hypothetical protein HY286_04430 [Planctomycetes bacterium]|nr:hypothetical protein [Planctomycetota bacterium]